MYVHIFLEYVPKLKKKKKVLQFHTISLVEIGTTLGADKVVAVASVIIAAFIVAIMIMIDAASGITKVCAVWAKVIILKVAIVKIISQVVVAVWRTDMEKLLSQPCDLYTVFTCDRGKL